MTYSARAAPSTASPSPFAVFRRRNFSLIWTGQFVSTISSSLTSLAASILIYRLTGSALSVGLMLKATAAPSVLAETTVLRRGEKMRKRLARTNLSDLPRFAGYDQATLRELRTEPVPLST